MRRLLMAGVLAMVAGCTEGRQVLVVAQNPGLWCYRTLADPDCFAEPQPGPPNRLIAAVLPDTIILE